jgi:two-component system, sensor histidine kinase and response regulator
MQKAFQDHEQQARRRAVRPLLILLAEDNDVNQMMAVGLLESWGHQVVVANNGLEALAALEKQVFDVALMDVQMPEMDGFRATAAIREKEKSTAGHVHIVAMTAYAIKGDRERCLTAGMDSYLSKPIKSTELWDVLERLGKSAPAVPPTPPAEAVFDPSALLSFVDGNRELLDKVIRRFLDSRTRYLTQIKDALACQDSKNAEFHAHKLKGAVGNFFAQPAWKVAQRLESATRNGELKQAAELCREAEHELDRLAGALAAMVNQEQDEQAQSHPVDPVHPVSSRAV